MEQLLKLPVPMLEARVAEVEAKDTKTIEPVAAPAARADKPRRSTRATSRHAAVPIKRRRGGLRATA
jgi:hypothetical protein